MLRHLVSACGLTIKMGGSRKPDPKVHGGVQISCRPPSQGHSLTVFETARCLAKRATKTLCGFRWLRFEPCTKTVCETVGSGVHLDFRRPHQLRLAETVDGKTGTEIAGRNGGCCGALQRRFFARGRTSTRGRTRWRLVCRVGTKRPCDRPPVRLVQSPHHLQILAICPIPTWCSSTWARAPTCSFDATCTQTRAARPSSCQSGEST